MAKNSIKNPTTKKTKQQEPRKGSLPSLATVTQLASASAAVDTKTGWTFLSNHAHVVILLAQDPSMVLREVASRIGITERAVQRIVADLEEVGVIERQKSGRQNHYRILAKQPLRHPIEAHRTIGDLISLITSRT